MKKGVLLIFFFLLSCQVKKFATYDDDRISEFEGTEVSAFDQFFIRKASDEEFYQAENLVTTNTSNEVFHQYTEELKDVYLLRKVVVKKEDTYVCSFFVKNNTKSLLTVQWDLLDLESFLGGYKNFIKTLKPNQQSSWKTQLSINPLLEEK